jgi:arsenite-transporting ATPase
VRPDGDGGHVLEVALPFTSREDVQLSRDGDELMLQVDGLRRTIVLPRALVDTPTVGAKMEDGILRIRFERLEGARPGKSSRPTKRGD